MNEHHWIEEALLVKHEPEMITVNMGVQHDNLITVKRTYHERGTHGVLTFPDGFQFYTLERPWLDNERRISCIPEGVYDLEMRYSPIVQRTSGGEYANGYEVTGVEGRDLIMIHVGNYVRDTAGCLLVGSVKSFKDGDPVVWSSRQAFRKMMKKMSGQDWQISFKEAV